MYVLYGYKASKISLENMNLDSVIEYKKDGVRHHFLEEY